MNTLDQQIADTRKEIDGLIDCFVKKIFPLFGQQWDYYAQLTVKLQRLLLKKELDNSSVYNPISKYKVAEGYKI